MNKLLLLLSVLLLNVSAQAQNDNRFILNFNAHGNDYARTNERQFRYNFWFPSIEYQLVNGNNLFSFELAKFTQKVLGSTADDRPSIIADYKDRNTQGLIRFQYQKIGKILIKDTMVSIKPYWGAAATPHYANTRRTPLKSIYYPKAINSYGLTAHASLGLYWEFKRLFINTNALIGLGQVEYVERTIHNPTVPYNERTLSATTFKLLPKDNLFRIGIGMKI